jgi:hypothetical protein
MDVKIPGTDTGIRIPLLNAANTEKNQSGTQNRYLVPGKGRAVLNTGIQYSDFLSGIGCGITVYITFL